MTVLKGNLRRWTQQAKSCYELNCDCSKCELKKYLETECTMYKVVPALYVKFGEPPETFYTSAEFQDFDNRKPRSKPKLSKEYILKSIQKGMFFKDMAKETGFSENVISSWSREVYDINFRSERRKYYGTYN